MDLTREERVRRYGPTVVDRLVAGELPALAEALLVDGLQCSVISIDHSDDCTIEAGKSHTRIVIGLCVDVYGEAKLPHTTSLILDPDILPGFIAQLQHAYRALPS